MLKALAAVFALILAVSVTPAAAQTFDDKRQSERGRAKQGRDTAQTASLFAEAASIYEDIVNLCLSGRAGAVRVNLDSARGGLMRLRPFLNDATAATLDRHLKNMETAEASGNLTTIALSAAESFRYVVIAMNPRMRSTPLEVSMYTYWAFRLVILASAAEIEWTVAAVVARESAQSGIALRRMIRDQNMRTLLEENQSGLREAVARNDAAGVKFAARVMMASTSVLRDFFDRMARTAQSR